MKNISKNSKIAIIGSGPAGLTAACYLKDSGFNNITIFEKEGRAGGKCCSFVYDGRTYELGAVLGTRFYKVTMAMMNRAGIKPNIFGSHKNIAIPGTMKKLGYQSLAYVFPNYIDKKEIPSLIYQLIKYLFIAIKFHHIYKPGFSKIHPDLTINFNEWMNKYNMNVFGKLIQIPFTTFGYGYYNEVPAAYVLKYMDVPTVASLVFRLLFRWEGGVQKVWENLAAGFDVKFNSKISKIRRNENIVITNNGEDIEADYLIITSPLDELQSVMDISDDENCLFEKISYYDYYVFSCVVENFPVGSGFIPRNFCSDKKGHMMIWDRRNKDKNLFTIYAIGDPSQSEDDVKNIIISDIQQGGGSISSFVAAKKWKYFPHVKGDDLNNDFYIKLESFQGNKNTFYAGEVMSFSTVEISARYSKHLVEKYFG